jgi:hypothetical protein
MVARALRTRWFSAIICLLAFALEISDEPTERSINFDRFFGSTHPEIFDEIDQAPSTGILMGEGLYNPL